MDYKIIDIEGVGDVYAEKLIAAGINKVSELLEKCAAPKGRQELAEATGISEKLILRCSVIVWQRTCSRNWRRSMPSSTSADAFLLLPRFRR